MHLRQGVGSPSFPGVDHAFFSPQRILSQLQVLSEPYRQHGPTYAIINALANNIAQVPFLVKTGSRKEPRVVEEGESGGEWLELLEDPNPFLSSAQTKKAIVVWLSLSGETMIVKESREDRPIEPDEIPLRIWPLNGKDFDPIVDRRTSRLRGWAHRAQGAEARIFLPHEVVHVKYYNPYDPLRGLAPWEASMLDARQDFKASIYNEAFFENDATPGVVLVSQKPLHRDQKKDLQEAWENRHRGFTRRRRVALLQGGLDIRELSATHREMEFVQLKNMTLTALLGIYKVPRQELALEEHDNRATALARDRGFWTKTLIPIMRLIEDELWTQLTKDPSDGRVWIEFDLSVVEALNEGLDAKLEMVRKLQEAGYTLNQANEFLGLELPKPDPEVGDQVWVPPGLVPIEAVKFPDSSVEFDEFTGSPGLADEEEESQEVPSGEEGETGPSSGEVNEDEEVAEESAPAEGTAGVLTSVQKATVAAFVRARTEEDERRWRTILRASMIPHEPRFRRRYGNYLFKLREEQLKLLAKSGLGKKSAGRKFTEADVGFLVDEAEFDEFIDKYDWIPEVRASIDQTVFDEEKWAKRVKQMHRPIYFEVTQDATGQVFDELGGNFAFDVLDPRVLRVVQKRELILAKTNRTIRRAVKKQLQIGVANGESIREIADRVKRVFNFAKARSLTIARTEVAGATNGARFETMEGEGVEVHQWITARDEAVRFSHEKQEGKRKKIGKPFVLINQKGERSELLHPNDPAGPPGEIINCRCVAVARD